ncbi:hypothetical protein ACFL0T_07000 [Candidatus Omnitrophota bacterium]
MINKGKINIIIMLVVCIGLSELFLSGFDNRTSAYAQGDLSHISSVVADLKNSDVSFCITFVRASDMNSKQIADIIFTWNPKDHKRNIAAIFRSKITRLSQRLRTIDYEQLIIDIDLIKNSHLTTGQIVKMLKGCSVKRKG